MTPGLSSLYVVLAFALAVGGGAIGATVGHSHRRLCILISLGAGTLLGVTVFAILPESFEAMRWWELALALGSGYGVFFVISKYVYHVCPACAASHFDEAATHRFSEIATALTVALAIHCTVDGLALAAGHEAHAHAASGRALDFGLILAISVHKVPEGLALGALLRGAGFDRSKTIFRVGAVESTTVLGGLVGLLGFHEISEFWLAALLAHAGGGFLYLAAHAVLGEVVKHSKTVVIAGFAAGFGMIGVLVLLLRYA